MASAFQKCVFGIKNGFIFISFIDNSYKTNAVFLTITVSVVCIEQVNATKFA